MCKVASVRNVGGMVWLSWAGARLPSGSRTKPRHGSTLIGMSKDGAAVLGELYSQGNIPRQHNDLALLHHLYEKLEHAPHLQASYVYPCVGCFKGHISGSEVSLGWRLPQWEETWVQEGIQQSTGGPDARARWLCRFQKKDIGWICQIPLPETGADPGTSDMRWFTLRATRADKRHVRWQQHQQATRYAPPP